MLIDLLKFIHIIFVLGLLGAVGYCLYLVGTKRFAMFHFNQGDPITRLNKIMLYLALCAILTGTFLVYPKHFTFHTPWIKAAYVLVGFFCLVMGTLIFFKKKRHKRWWRLIYLVMLILLVGVTHDAVTKSTFLF